MQAIFQLRSESILSRAHGSKVKYTYTKIPTSIDCKISNSTMLLCRKQQTVYDYLKLTKKYQRTLVNRMK